MKQLEEFFRGLFDTDQWPPRWKCGTWSDFHGWLYIISDLTIWLAYFLIPLIIINYFTTRKTGIRFQKVYILFASFILLCGTTHFIDAMMFWVPMYRLNGLIRFLTGVVSMFTVYHLIQILPQVTKQRTSLELEKEIALREQAEKKLSEVNAQLAAFASVASHDLQEPARKIRTFAGLVYMQNENKFDNDTKTNMKKIISGADRMQALIKDVLSLSTISDNVEFNKIYLNDAAKRAVENLELVIAEKNAVINITELPIASGNLEYLTQVFTNLISNAIKFNDQLPIINITGERKNRQVFVYISDNGIRLTPEHYEKIFEPFGRAHSKNKYQGTGIGLAICKRIMEVHNGSISVESTVGAGTRFTLTFPNG